MEASVVKTRFMESKLNVKTVRWGISNPGDASNMRGYVSYTNEVFKKNY